MQPRRRQEREETREGSSSKNRLRVYLRDVRVFAVGLFSCAQRAKTQKPRDFKMFYGFSAQNRGFFEKRCAPRRRGAQRLRHCRVGIAHLVSNRGQCPPYGDPLFDKLTTEGNSQRFPKVPIRKQSSQRDRAIETTHPPEFTRIHHPRKLSQRGWR